MPPTRHAREKRSFGWWWIAFAWLAWGMINSARLGAVLELDWQTAIWYGLPDALIWATLTPLVVGLTRRTAASGEPFTRSLAFHVPAAVAVALLHTTADTSLAALRHLADGQAAQFTPIFGRLLAHTFHINVLIYFLVAGFAYYILSSERLQHQDRLAAELRAQLTEARLSRLQMQLRPHFLFNALHAISSLMVTDPKLGQRVIRRLGDLLRMSLRTEDRHTIPLDQELEFVAAYLEVEKARFGDRLTVDVDVNATLGDCHVPALILQPLVENAVHHGVSLNVDGGRVSVRATGQNGCLRLEVTDDGPGLRTAPAVSESPGLGLANARERLEALYGEAYEFSIEPAEPTGTRVTIVLPKLDRPAP